MSVPAESRLHLRILFTRSLLSMFPGLLGPTPKGSTTTVEIVGGFSTGTSSTHGFLYSGGGFTTVDVPGASSTYPGGINDNVQIVGGFQDNIGGSHGFLYSGGSFTTIVVPGATMGGSPHAINNSGQIVGEFQDTLFSGYMGTWIRAALHNNRRSRVCVHLG